MNRVIVMSFEMVPAIMVDSQILFAQIERNSEWFLVKTEFRFTDRIVIKVLKGREVYNLVSAILGYEPQERMKNLLWQCRGKPVGVCVETITDSPLQRRICSFFHITENDANELVHHKVRNRRKK